MYSGSRLIGTKFLNKFTFPIGKYSVNRDKKLTPEHRRRTHPATRHIPKVLEPCRRIERSARSTRASVTLCCDQFRGRYDHCNRLGRPRNSSGRPWNRLGRAARRDGGSISDAYAPEVSRLSGFHCIIFSYYRLYAKR